MTSPGFQRSAAALSGLLFVSLFGTGFVISTFFTTEWYPSPFGPSNSILEFVANNRDQLRVISTCYVAASVALIMFSAYIATFVRQATSEMRGMAELALSGGVLSASALLAMALMMWVLGREQTSEEPALVRMLHDLVYLVGGPAHIAAFAPFIGASSLVSIKTRVLPGWVGWLGIAAAVPSLVSITTLIWESGSYILPVARTLAFAWITAVSLLLAKHQLMLFQNQSRTKSAAGQS